MAKSVIIAAAIATIAAGMLASTIAIGHAQTLSGEELRREITI
jgi:hypothetical protein